MPTVNTGSVASIYCPLASTITVTPGAVAKVSVQSVGSPSFQAVTLTGARTFSVAAGDLVNITAINSPATYTDPALSAAQVAAVATAIAPGTGIVNIRGDAPVDEMTSVAQIDSQTAAISTTAVLSATATQSSTRVRVASTDTKRPVGSTTDAAGYAVGIKTINLASAGTGAFYKGDVITFAGQSNEYTLLAGDADVSNGGSITLAGYGLVVTLPASATAITLVRRTARLLIALNCDNAVEGLIASQSAAQRDAEVVIGEVVTLQSPVPISTVWTSCEVSVLSTAHRLDVCFGA